MAGRVDILWRIIEKNAKELKIKSQDLPVILSILTFFGARTFYFLLL